MITLKMQKSNGNRVPRGLFAEIVQTEQNAKQTGVFILKMNNIGKNLVIIGNNHYLCMRKLLIK